MRPTFSWPLDDYRVPSCGWRCYGPGLTGDSYYPLWHLAVDFPCPSGTPVRCSAPGTVETVAWHVEAGYYIEVEHEDGWWTRYLHLTGGSELAIVGQLVERGEVLALSGASGRVFGAHLHFVIWAPTKALALAIQDDPAYIAWGRNEQGAWAVDPMLLLQDAPVRLEGVEMTEEEVRRLAREAATEVLWELLATPERDQPSLEDALEEVHRLRLHPLKRQK